MEFLVAVGERVNLRLLLFLTIELYPDLPLAEGISGRYKLFADAR